MIGQAKRAIIQDAAEDLLTGSRRVDQYDASVITHALKRVSEPLSGEEDGMPGYSENDRDLMYEVLVYRINKYQPNDDKIHLKEL